jgi:hypothetical protein
MLVSRCDVAIRGHKFGLREANDLPRQQRGPRKKEDLFVMSQKLECGRRGGKGDPDACRRCVSSNNCHNKG